MTNHETTLSVPFLFISSLSGYILQYHDFPTAMLHDLITFLLLCCSIWSLSYCYVAWFNHFPTAMLHDLITFLLLCCMIWSLSYCNVAWFDHFPTSMLHDLTVIVNISKHISSLLYCHSQLMKLDLYWKCHIT